MATARMITKLLLPSICQGKRGSIQIRRLLSVFSETPTISDVHEQLMKIVSAPLVWQTVDRSSESSLIPESQEQLPPRHMRDSYSEAFIRLSDPEIREKYINAYRTVRIGRLLEDLDTLGVFICYKHNMPDVTQETSPLTIVTALVDRLEMHEDVIKTDRDLKIAGNVTWAGSSSLEVTMTIHQLCDNEEPQHMLSATIVNVARDPLNENAAFVHPLVPSCPEEESMLTRGAQRKLLRQQRFRDSLLKSAPNADERELIHNIFLDTLQPGVASFYVRRLPPNSVWMDETKVKNALLCFPEERNIHNKIFGGFLMRKATETAYTNALLFSRKRITLLAVDDIQFKKPVEIGSALLISSQIAYVEGNHMQVRVHTEVEDVKTGHRDTTNVFHFVYSSENVLPRIIPKTYGESMLYLDGRRHYLSVMESE